MEVKLNDKINQNWLYATKKYLKNDIIFVLSGEEYLEPTRETIRVGDNKHIYDKYGIYINHSFNPSIYIDNYNVIAIRNIEINEELTFDYNKNEINMASPFICDGINVCGKNN